ncbi:MAG: response regulator [Spirochaetota bacterium]
MPGIYGDEANSQLRQLPGGEQVKVIMLGTQSTAEIPGCALEAGAGDFMAKPFRQSDLFEKVRVLTAVSYIFDQLIQSQDVAARPPELIRLLEGQASP